jgi:acetolactate synthase-1/2/3 large subunit
VHPAPVTNSSAVQAETNAELIVRSLEAAGVRWAFGIPSGPVLPLIDAMARSSIQYVLTASETSAGFMAAVVGELTGNPGVCVSTLGPGATNMATGVGAAWLDRAPVVAITCNVETPWLERRIQMRIDHHALFRPLTKATLPLRAGTVGAALGEAITVACAEPPGPVHLDLPEDIGRQRATDGLAVLPEPEPLPPIPQAAFETLGKALRTASRPLLVIGMSLTRSRHPERLTELLARQGMPYVSTLHAKGCLPESHPLYGGVIGRARRTDVQALVRQADLIVGVGYDPIEINYEEWVGEIPIAHLDTEQAETDPRLHFVVNEGGDLDDAIERLVALPPGAHSWTEAELASHRSRLEANLRPPTEGFAPHQALDLLRAKLPDTGILAYDVGAHTHQIATQWRTDRRGTMVATNGWSSMGFGIPATYAAKLVHPDRAVVGVVGDGCFEMTAGELAVGRRLNLAAPIVVLNDGWLTLLRIKQDHKAYERSGVDLGARVPSPAHYFGVPVRSAMTPAEFEAVVDWALDLDGPSVIEAFVEPEPYSQTVYD